VFTNVCEISRFYYRYESILFEKIHFYYNSIVHNFNQHLWYLMKFQQHFTLVFMWHKVKVVKWNLHNQINTRRTTRNAMNQNYIMFLPVDLSESSAPNLSPLASVMFLLVALECGSVGTEGPIPVDHTLTIKSVKAYWNKISIQFQSSIQKHHTFTWSLKTLLYFTHLTTFTHVI